MAITTRRGYCSWTVDHASCKWVVILPAPEEQDLSGQALEEALAWRLVWLMAPELGGGTVSALNKRAALLESDTRIAYVDNQRWPPPERAPPPSLLACARRAATSLVTWI